MEKQSLSRGELAKQIGRSVEHVRKLETGRAFPGKDLQQKLIVALAMSDDEAAEFNASVKLDRWIDWFGVPPRAAGDADMPEYWGKLTREQKAALNCVAQCLLRGAEQT